MALISISQLEKTYNKNTSAAVHALKGISFSVDAGDLVAVVGTSGSGKSTLLHILACLDQEYDGTYLFSDEDIHSLSASKLAALRNQKIGIVLQNFGLIYDMTVFDNIVLPVYLSGERYNKRDLRTRVQTLLESFGIEDKINVKASQLSGGQKQRVAIARALIHDPVLILADEPTGALDQATSEEIMSIFTQLNNQGKTVMIVTHDKNIASKCTRTITISDGMLISSN